VLLLAITVACGPSQTRPGDDSGGSKAKGALISGLLINPSTGYGAVSIEIANPTDKPIDLAGCSLTDELGKRGKYIRARGHHSRRDLVFPSGTRATVLPPGGALWVARDAAVFRREFGVKPTFEVNEDSAFAANDPTVADIVYEGPESKRGSWLGLSRGGASIVALVDSDDSGDPPVILSVVPYNMGGGRKATPKRPDQRKIREAEAERDLAVGSLWRGAPLMTSSNIFLPSPPISTRNRIYRRDRDANGRIVPETRSFADWDGASSYTGLGEDLHHRLWVPGQSDLRLVRHDQEAIVTMTAAPESNHAGTIAAFDAAKRDIKVHIYYFSSPAIADALVRAVKRGVDVALAMEGGVVGVKNGFSDKERLIAKRIEDAGRERSKNDKHGLGRVYWIRSDRKAGIDDRYSYDHSKYAIIDERGLIIGSENYGSTGHPVSNTYGNRGWEIQIRTPEGKPTLGVVKDLLSVWRADVNPERHHDYIRYDDDSTTRDMEGRGRYGPPPPDTKAKSDLRYGRYVPRDPPQETVREVVGAELVVSPDNSLNESGSMLGAIAKAKHTLLVQHLSMATQWGGRRYGSPEKTPNILLQACVAAARRGVKVRIQLSCRGFACDRLDASWEGNKIDNDDLHEMVNKLARKEKLDLQVRLMDTTSDDWLDDPEHHGALKIHNKGLSIDGSTTLFASINGVENSFKANREIGVLVTSKKVGRFYEELFWYDWTTIMGPRGLRVERDHSKKARKKLAADSQRASVLLTGLQPGKRYYIRVSAIDDDTTDVETTRPPTPLGPHESALSDEIAVDSTLKGTILLSWQRNRSECLEGDLAGYKVYYGQRSATTGSGGLMLPEDVARMKRYGGTGAKEGASPVLVPAAADLPQCIEMRAIQVTREAKPDNACVQLLDRVGQCLGKGGDVFTQLDKALQPHGPVGSKRWQRRRATLLRACTAPPLETAKTWQQEREECAKVKPCGELWSCIRESQAPYLRRILPQRFRN